MTGLVVVGDIFGFLPDPADLPGGAVAGHRLWRLADLAGRPDLDGEALHGHLFAGGGLATVVERLAATEARGMVGLGFSAGGTALWRAVAAGLDLAALVCVSSTRLGEEIEPPAIPTRVFWGGRDPRRPPEAWNAAIPTDAVTFPEAEHAFYRDRTTPATIALWDAVGALLAATAGAPASE
jgi:hypothetical protein